MASDPSPRSAEFLAGPDAGGPAGDAGREFRDRLDTFRTAFDGELARWLDGRPTLGDSQPRGAGDLTRSLREFALRGGKRLRPALVDWAYRACGGTSDDAVLPLAMAVELLHTYLLVHDDVMDHAETRRGGPAVHTEYARRHAENGWDGDSGHFGQSVALLLGDLAHSYAVELFATALVRGGGRELRRAFSEMSNEVIVGQYLEFTVPFREQPSEEELLEILRMKSGRYSVERPIQLGAHLAGAPPATVQALARYGRATGEAFQLRDDLLGVFGSPQKTGKPVGSDLAEGKLTLLVFHALRRLPAADRRELEAALGARRLDPERIDRMLGLLEASGARRVVTGMIDDRLAEARGALAAADIRDAERELFRGLVDYLRERDR